MVVTFLQQKKIQRNLIFIFLGVILITVIVFWQGFFKKEKLILPEGLIGVPPEVKIDFEFFKNPILEELQSFSEIQPFIEITPKEEKGGEKLGRENPFLPY